MDSQDMFHKGCSCHPNERPSFSAPFLQYSCPANFNEDNELLLKDPQLRKRAMVNTIDCGLHDALNGQESPRGPDYGRSSGKTFRAVQAPLGYGDVEARYCRTGN